MRILRELRAINEGNVNNISDFTKNQNKIVTTIQPKGHYTLIVRARFGEDLDVLDCFGLDDH
jgi:hypothetical protein